MTLSKTLIKKNAWRFHDQCISCESQQYNAQSNIQPKWTLSETCINCDVEPANIPTPPLPWVKVRNSAVCDGFGGTWSRLEHHNCSNNNSCVKQLIPRGTPTVRPEDCVVMARNDPECSNYVMSRINGTYSCYCYKTLSCCGICSAKSSTTYDIYELTATPSDPTCANGIRSADNTTCCTLSCGVGGCRNQTSTVTQVGFCNAAGTITRSCAMYGPPCKI